MARTDGGAVGSEDDARSALEEGNRLAREGKLEAAEAAYRKADELGDGTAAAYAGLFAEARGDLAGARASYERADERGDGFGAFQLGMLLSRAGDWDAAAEAWSRAEQRGQEQPPFEPRALNGAAGAVEQALVPPADIQRSAFASPVLIGAVTVLVAIIAVFLAYNANTGLPFVPTRQLKVDIANGAALVTGNDVMIGGYRVGLVSAEQPFELANGTVGAQLTLNLNESTRVPVDSTATVSDRSVLGEKYLNLNLGSSKRMFTDGATMPIRQTDVPVQFDDIDKMFDAKTRPAVEQNLAGYGDVLTGRGAALNDTIASLPQLFQHLKPVAAYLSDPRTELTRFLVALDGFMGTVAPVAQTNEQLFANQATTFQAVSSNAADLEDTIKQSPPTLQVSTSSLQAQQPFLSDLTTFAGYFAPATAQLREALPNIDPALEAGVKVLPRTPQMNQKLQGVLEQLKSLALDPGTNVALNGLNSTVTTLNPMIRYLGPYVTVCNEWNYFWDEIQDLVSEQTNMGMAQRALLQFGNQQTNSVGDQGATEPADGQGVPPSQAPEYLHAPDYGAAIDGNGNADCEVGQRGYPQGLDHSDSQYPNLDMDAHTPGTQGTTWAGLSRVPPGETYTRSPSTGPQLPSDPANP
jgi:virulence factor Mce-like protein